MPVPFRNAAEMEAGGAAAFFRIRAGGADLDRAGGLLQVNGRGEPLEFTYSRLERPTGSLWSSDGVELAATRALAAGVFEAAQRTPIVLMCLAAEIPTQLLTDELRVQIPVCRLARPNDEVDSGDVVEEISNGGEPIRLAWRPRAPSTHSPVRRLVDALASRGLLLEPFDRVTAGIEEQLASHD